MRVRPTPCFLVCSILLYGFSIAILVCIGIYLLYGQHLWLWIGIWIIIIQLTSFGFVLAAWKCLAWFYVRTVVYVWETKDKSSLAEKDYEVWVDDHRIYTAGNRKGWKGFPFYVEKSNPLSMQLRRNESYCLSVRYKDDKKKEHVNSIICEPAESRFVDMYLGPM